MDVISMPKKIGCILIAIATNLIMFSSCLVGGLSDVFMAMFLCVPSYSAMMLIYPNFLYILFPILTAFGIFFVTDNILIVILFSMFLLLAALCSEGASRKRTKFDTIVRMSVVMFFAAILMFVVAVFITQGIFSRDAIYDFSNEIMNEYIKSVEMLGGNADIYIVLFDELSKIIPATFLTLFVVLTYFSCTFTRKIVYWFKCEYSIFNFDNYWEFEMPIETAYIYILAYAFQLFTPFVDAETPVLDVVLYIVIYPLMFGMFVSGIKQIKEIIKHQHHGKALIVFLIIVGAIIFFDLAFTVTTFIGVFRCFNINKSKKWTVEK